MIALLATMALADDAVELRRLELSVSESRGRNGGVVIFWPRVIPATLDNEVSSLAAELQSKLIDVATRATPLAHRDIRPSPERVCPRDRGCKAVSLGVLIGQQDGGCVAVAVLGPPGVADLELIPLAGVVELASTQVPFRSPPEDVVTIREFVPCSTLPEVLDDSGLVMRVRQALRE